MYQQGQQALAITAIAAAAIAGGATASATAVAALGGTSKLSGCLRRG